MVNTDLFYKDLSTFSKKDLHTLFRYYHVSSISQLVPKITKKASLPSGTVFSAVENNNFDDFMEFLNDPNFDPNIRDSRGDTILMKCVIHTKTNGEKYLLELLKKHPNLNLQNNDGWTALILASRNSNIDSTEETVKILVAAGANLNIQNNGGKTALILASTYSNTDSTEGTVKILVKAGANLNLQNNDGNTSLMLASTYSRTESTEETVKILVAAGANLNLQNNEGETALMLSSIHSNTDSTEETVKILVDGPPGGPGTDLNLKNNDGNTALILASQYSNKYSTVETVKILVAAGADLNIQNNNGNTALMWASRNNIEETVKILLDAGADLNLKNNDGETAIEMTTNLDIKLLLLDGPPGGPGAKLTDSKNLKDIVKIKIREIKNELEKYKNKLSDLELELLKCDEGHKESGIEEIKNLKDCVKKAKELKRYRPGEGGALKIKEKYINNPYFSNK